MITDWSELLLDVPAITAADFPTPCGRFPPDGISEVPDSEVIDQLKTAVNILWGILLVVLLFKGIGIVLLEFRHLITERRLLGILETAARRKRGSPGSFWITSRDFTPV